MLISRFFLLLLILTLLDTPAYAYIDPGTGSFMIQMLIAGFVSLTFVMKIFWKKIGFFFQKIFHKSARGKK